MRLETPHSQAGVAGRPAQGVAELLRRVARQGTQLLARFCGTLESAGRRLWPCSRRIAARSRGRWSRHAWVTPPGRDGAEDATGLSRGGSRFEATDATGLSRGPSRFAATASRLQLRGYKPGALASRMPRACPVEGSRFEATVRFLRTFASCYRSAVLLCSKWKRTPWRRPMRIEPYTVEECRFAYCYHVYLRWSTHCRRSQPALSRLSSAVAQEQAQEYGIGLLEWQAAETEVRALVSLQPGEAVAVCASKLKGRTSKWLREELKLDQPTSLLSKATSPAPRARAIRPPSTVTSISRANITATPTELSRRVTSAVSRMPTRNTSAPSTLSRCCASTSFWGRGADVVCSLRPRLGP